MTDHPVTDFIRAELADDPTLAWPGEIDDILDDSETYERSLIHGDGLREALSTLAMARSIALSGERWSETAETEYRAAVAATRGDGPEPTREELLTTMATALDCLRHGDTGAAIDNLRLALHKAGPPDAIIRGDDHARP